MICNSMLVKVLDLLAFVAMEVEGVESIGCGVLVLRPMSFGERNVVDMARRGGLVRAMVLVVFSAAHKVLIGAPVKRFITSCNIATEACLCQ